VSEKYQALRRAAELLREGAEELKAGHCKRGPRWFDWTGEPEAKAAYDEAMSVADDLDQLQAQVEQLITEAKVASDRIQELGRFTKAQRGEIEGLRAVRVALDRLVAHIGMDGEIDANHPAVHEALNALNAIDSARAGREDGDG